MSYRTHYRVGKALSRVLRVVGPATGVHGDEDAAAAQDALVWQARAQVDLSVMIERYLTEHPAPALAADAHRYRVCAADLRAAGEADLARLGDHHLRLVEA